MTKIVVTGLGCITAIGNNLAEFEKNLFAGVSGIKPVERVELIHSRTRIAAEISGFTPSAHFNENQLSQMDRHTFFSLMSAREAIADAGLSFNGPLAERTGVIYGTGMGCQNTVDEISLQVYGQGAKRLHPFTVPKLMPSASCSHISMEFGIKGPSLTTSTACSSSSHAMGVAMMMLRSGMVDVVICGGSEAPITPGGFIAWESLRILARDTCRPFSSGRGGLVLGEGAATLVLETLEHAQARSAKIYAELAGFGMSSDAGNLVQPSIDGMERAVINALNDANVAPESVSYINAHGTGTPQNDPMETATIRRVFGSHANKLLVSSTKSMHGHVLGGTAAIEAVATILAITTQCAPPTMGYLGQDTECDLNYVPNEKQPLQIDVAISNSFAFGGLNSVLVFKRFND